VQQAQHQVTTSTTHNLNDSSFDDDIIPAVRKGATIAPPILNLCVFLSFHERSYPTTVFFNGSKPHSYHGEHSSSGLSDFVMEILRPSVINLDYEQFRDRVEKKPIDEMWLVDFYAPCKLTK
jgi:hypothetical protein